MRGAPALTVTPLGFCNLISEGTGDDDVVLRHTLPVFTGLGRCPIVSWDFAGAVSIFGLDALPVIHQ